MIVDVQRLARVALTEYPDVVGDADVVDLNHLKLLLVDGTWLNVWYSLKLEGRYSYHWDRASANGTLFRHDNCPHVKWNHVRTSPAHFHHGNANTVMGSEIPTEPAMGLRFMLRFVRETLQQESQEDKARAGSTRNQNPD